MVDALETKLRKLRAKLRDIWKDTMTEDSLDMNLMVQVIERRQPEREHPSEDLTGKKRATFMHRSTG